MVITTDSTQFLNLVYYTSCQSSRAIVSWPCQLRSLRSAVLLLLRNFSATSSVWSLELHFRTSRRCDYCTFRRSTLDTGLHRFCIWFIYHLELLCAVSLVLLCAIGPADCHRRPCSTCAFGPVPKLCFVLFDGWQLRLLYCIHNYGSPIDLKHSESHSAFRATAS